MKFIKNRIADAGLLFLGFISIAPFIYMFIMSFKSTINAYDMSISLSEMSLIQYQKIFEINGFSRYVFNSFFVAAAGVILTVTICSLAGYAFAKMDFKGNDKLFLFLIFTMAIPTEVIIVPLFLIVKNLGWLNTYRALILPLPTAFGVFIMRQAILDIPKDLIDASKIDGCNNMQVFSKVILPLVKSALLTLSIFTFVGAWNNFLWPLVASTKPEMKTLPLAFSLIKTQYNSDVGLTMACAVINFLPPFIFYIFLQSRFKEGIALSGVKG